jgi:hypothetical protein
MRGAACLLLLGSACAIAQGRADVDGAVPVDGLRGTIDGPAVSCTSSATCQTATSLGSISGDTGAGMQVASGYQSAWLRVRVTENDSSVSGHKLSVTARLTSPQSAVYDVYLYVNANTDQIECNTPTGTATNNGTTDTLRIEWGEGTVANGADDSRDVSIEVRPVSTQCSSSAAWQLNITGDT